MKDWRVLTCVCLGILAMPLCFSAGILAVPAIRQDIGGGPLELAWITNGYILVVGCSMLAAGTFADYLGRKKVFFLGLIGFTVLSAILGLANSAAWLAVLRTFQGVMGAALLAGGTALLANTFQGAARRKALSWIGTSFGVGLAMGPPISGLLIDLIGWRSIFFASALIGTIATIIGAGQLKESKDHSVTKIDVAGILTISVSLSFLTWAIMRAPIVGWRDITTALYLTGSILFLRIFVRLQLRSVRPMLDVLLFRESRFLAVQSLPIATTCCYVVLLLVLPIRLVSIEGMSSLRAGLAVFFLSFPLMLVPRYAARLAKNISPRALSTTGLVIASIGLLLLSMRQADDGIMELFVPLFVIGIGTGLPWGLMDGLAVSVVPVERAGMAAGVFNTMRLASEAVGLAMVGALLALLISYSLPDQVSASSAFKLALGDMQDMAADFPGMSKEALVAIYDDAFSGMLRILAMATLAFAGFVYAFLGCKGAKESCESLN